MQVDRKTNCYSTTPIKKTDQSHQQPTHSLHALRHEQKKFYVHELFSMKPGIGMHQHFLQMQVKHFVLLS